MKRYCIKVQENNVIKITPKLTEQLAEKVVNLKGVEYIEEPVGVNYSNVVIDLDYKIKVKLELTVLLK